MAGGILNAEQQKFWSQLIVDELPFKGILKLVSKFAIPVLLEKLDDDYLEKIPSPYKEYATQLLTTVYLAAEDRDISEEEIAEWITLCTAILNEKIDIPSIDEQDETIVFQSLLKLIATILIKKIRAK